MKQEKVHGVFELDCNQVIPECKFQCGKCISEMDGIFERTEGVVGFCTEGEGENMKFIVEYDPNKILAEQLIKIFRRLPSYYKGFFRPILIAKK